MSERLRAEHPSDYEIALMWNDSFRDNRFLSSNHIFDLEGVREFYPFQVFEAITNDGVRETSLLHAGGAGSEQLCQSIRKSSRMYPVNDGGIKPTRLRKGLASNDVSLPPNTA